MPSQIDLTIEQKIGQLFFIGLPGPRLDSETEELLQEIQPGGVCLFARNIKSMAQTRQLNDAVGAFLPVFPFIAVDQEGGRVDRLRRIFPPMPAASEIGRTKNLDLIARFAEITGKILRQLGFNLNFAPVADVVSSERENSQNGLYSRNLGVNATETAEFAGIYLKHLQAQNCLGCLKHFPGLGAIEIDSHDRLPFVNIDEKEFNTIDLFPFREILNNCETHFVMTAHAAYSFLEWQEKDADDRFLPSSLSPNLILNVLREQLKFSGIVLTDDLEMGAIVENYGIGDAALTAFNAGNDMLTICAGTDSMRAAFNSIKSAVEKKNITIERLNESVERILKVKNSIVAPVEFDEQTISDLTLELKHLTDKIA